MARTVDEIIETLGVKPAGTAKITVSQSELEGDVKVETTELFSFVDGMRIIDEIIADGEKELDNSPDAG